MPELTLLDANPARRYAKGHVPGAVLVDPAAVGEVLPDDRSTALVFYCRDRSCGAAPAAARRAMALGYDNVHVMRDGIDGWERSGGPVSTD
ncbi:rhodanese-like domain-containing protein [Saccharothrix syringae]|uniref:rhodanese-like domain-containing protein n=1 Tax=Saccharothrix syringae TaxID=103733 RepID=UPI0014774476|nr:rhodanese-like domain-containing protein [Saccharothrix syringae]